MSIEPYVEAERVRTVPQPVSGGIDISSFSRFLQGVSNRSRKRQYTSLLPQLGTGQDDFQDIDREFGQSQFFVANESFVDGPGFDPIAYLEDPDQFKEPLIVGDFVGMDGAIEPLTIRDVASRDSIESPFISRAIKGALMDGNENMLGHSDRKFSYFEVPPTSDFEFYLDGSDEIGGISLPPPVGDGQQFIRPYDDTIFPGRKLTNDNEINQALLAMDGVIDDEFLPNRTKASTSGFVYYGNDAGTDSLAFGGLLNQPGRTL